MRGRDVKGGREDIMLEGERIVGEGSAMDARAKKTKAMGR